MSCFLPQIKVSDELWQAFCAEAQTAGFTPTDYIRHKLFGEPKPNDTPAPDKRDVLAPDLETKDAADLER